MRLARGALGRVDQLPARLRDDADAPFREERVNLNSRNDVNELDCGGVLNCSCSRPVNFGTEQFIDEQVA